MKIGSPKYFEYGRSALLLSWSDDITSIMLRRIKYVDNYLNTLDHPGIIETTPAYNSILVSIDKNKISLTHIIGLVDKIASQYVPGSSPSICHKIRTNYSVESGIDLPYLSEVLNLSISEIINIHSKTIYDVHFVGFLPGFPYLGGLDSRLHIERRNNPRVRIPMGSIGIGGQQTGIYPHESPGGWHIIGHTDFKIIDPKMNPPSVFNIGDQVQFVPLSKT